MAEQGHRYVARTMMRRLVSCANVSRQFSLRQVRAVQDEGTYTRRSAFSLTSASFFACFAWFSFLYKRGGSSAAGREADGKPDVQPDVIRVQHALDGCKLAGLLGLSLCAKCFVFV